MAKVHEPKMSEPAESSSPFCSEARPQVGHGPELPCPPCQLESKNT